MFKRSILIVLAIAMLFAIAPALAEDPPANGAAKPPAGQSATPDPEAKKKTAEAERDTAAAKKKQEEDQRATAALLQGAFRADTLAGGTDNEFRVPQPANRLTTTTVKLEWDTAQQYRQSCDPSPREAGVSTKAADSKDPTKTVLGIYIPSPPCLWPLVQYAKVTIKTHLQRDSTTDEVPLLEARLPVSVLWFPLLMTAIILGLIYPGGAAASWYASVRQYKKLKMSAKKNEEIGPEPNFWRSLDPVELTKNPFGRGSIAKLQIFAFTFIIFGLLLFNVLRLG